MLSPSDYRGMCDGPGKFEGEPRAAEYYYDCIMNGDGETIYPEIDLPDDEPCLPEGLPCFALFTVSADELTMFEDDTREGDTIAIYENEQGFVSLLVYADGEAAQHDLNGMVD